MAGSTTAAEDTAPQAPEPPRAGAPTELRLALVCYGGVSLAIYMHGITKELHKLVRASRALDDPALADEITRAGDTELTYLTALRGYRDRPVGNGLSVTVDVIAGTSAGGINGVCLATVLANDGSQDALKKLWLDEGDFARLLRTSVPGPWKVKAAAVALSLVGHFLKPWSPLRGEHMSQLLYSAIGGMQARDGAATLLPPGGSVDLFVTTTDLQGITFSVPTGAGGISQRETDHAQVLHFTSAYDDTDHALGSVGALAFAARATSSFPGAFAPVSLTSFAEEIAGTGRVDAKDVARHFTKAYVPLGLDPAKAWFADGGLLDNAPFDHVVDAVAAKPARSQVVRRVVYLQPDPPGALSSHGQPEQLAGPPTYETGLVKSVVGARGSHSILPDLRRLEELNQRITDVATIVAMQSQQIDHKLRAAWTAASGQHDPDVPWDITRLEQVSALADQLYQDAQGLVGAGFRAYCRLKVDATMDALADGIVAVLGWQRGSSEAALLAATLRSWGRSRVQWDLVGADDAGPAKGAAGPGSGNPTKDSGLVDVLGAADLPYRNRRLLFVLAGINELYAVTDTGHADIPTRAQLDSMKDLAWSRLADLRNAATRALGGRPADAGPKAPATQALLPTVRELAASITEHLDVDPYDAARTHAKAIQDLFTDYRTALAAVVSDGGGSMWNDFMAQAAPWGESYRRALLSRFIGFPLWDALIFPTVALSHLPQFTTIAVDQFSPREASALADALRQMPGRVKLDGVKLGHFGAFADRVSRENDYLWGRLDAVELILRLLDEAAGGTPPTDRPNLLRQGLLAVLAAESGPEMSRTADLRRELATFVGRLPA